MDRINTNGPNGILARLRAKETSPVARAETARPVEENGARAADVAVASFVTAGQDAPVDHDRVDQIRKAVEQGRYPVVPAKIADAMIAAGYLLRTR